MPPLVLACHREATTVHGMDIADFIYSLGGAEERLAYVQGQYVDPEGLAILATDNDMFVREAVARRAETPTSVLMLLAGDKEAVVRRGVADNRHAPAAALLQLAEDGDWWVRLTVAANPSAPAEALSLLSRYDEEEGVRTKVALHVNTPAPILAEMSEEEDWYIKAGTVRNPATPLQARRRAFYEVLEGDEEHAYDIQESWAEDVLGAGDPFADEWELAFTLLDAGIDPRELEVAVAAILGPGFRPGGIHVARGEHREAN